MDFETLLNSSKDVIKEYLDDPEKLKEMHFDFKQATELIKAIGEASEYVENVEKFQNILLNTVDIENFSKEEEKNIKYTIVDLIKATGKQEEYLNNQDIRSVYRSYLILASGKAEEYLDNPEKLERFELSSSDIVELIESTGKTEEYLQDIDKLKKFGLDSYDIKDLIIASGKAEEYLQDIDRLKQFEFDSYDIKNLIIASGKVEEYLQDINKIKSFGLMEHRFELSQAEIYDLIEKTNDVDKYMTPEELHRLGLDYGPTITLIKASKNPEKYLLKGQNINDEELELSMANAIKATGDIERYLTPEKLQELDIFNKDIWLNLIKETGNEEKYLFDGENINAPKFFPKFSNIIKATGNIDAYLTKEKLEKFESIGYRYSLSKEDIIKLIKATGNIDMYLTKEKLEEFKSIGYEYSLSEEDIIELIKATGNIDAYLTKEKFEEFKALGRPIKKKAIIELIKATGNIDKYLTKEKLEEFKSIDRQIKSQDIIELIKATGNIDTYLTLEKLIELGLKDNNEAITKLVKESAHPKKYLLEGEDINNPQLQLNICNILKGTTCTKLTKNELSTLCGYDNEVIIMVSNIDDEKKNDATKILDRLDRSNSAELRRIKIPMALQILEKDQKEYEKTLNVIENVYLTSDVPDIGKLYLVFKELHPNLLGESSKIGDDSVGNIPSLKNITSTEKKSIIFSNLLMIAAESNNRNLREYLSTIEEGDQLFKKIRSGEMQVDDLKKAEKETITKYNRILNALYNQRNKAKRENIGDIAKDVNELATLYRMDNIKTEMPDRLIGLFAHRANIKSLAKAKELFESSRKMAEDRNEKAAQNGSISVEKGDFIKGVANTEYFPSMLQKGILAKDFLGGSATSDATPLDTDVEIIEKKGKTLRETLSMLEIANGFTDADVSNKKLGKIMLVFSKDNFIETRNKNGEESKENIKLLKNSPNKKEVCNNFGDTAYGISVGIGSENIKCIIADRYIDKLGLEIALNGFYIPIVDNDGKVIYTKEMYDVFRQKMKGLSHYDENHFELDETARKEEMTGILELVDKSMQNAKDKQEKILKTLGEAVKKNGYDVSEERRTDLKPGIVEFIDTGSTGRGTNMPDDGDFDYMVRLDKTLSDNPAELKNSLREALRKSRTTKRCHGNTSRI